MSKIHFALGHKSNCVKFWAKMFFIRPDPILNPMPWILTVLSFHFGKVILIREGNFNHSFSCRINQSIQILFFFPWVKTADSFRLSYSEKKTFMWGRKRSVYCSNNGNGYIFVYMYCKILSKCAIKGQCHENCNCMDALDHHKN